MKSMLDRHSSPASPSRGEYTSDAVLDSTADELAADAAKAHTPTRRGDVTRPSLLRVPVAVSCRVVTCRVVITPIRDDGLSGRGK
jgi:hypothetical protein